MKTRISLLVLVFCAPSLFAEEIAARLDWGRQVELGVAVSGVVDEVKVEAGDRVKAGQLLLSLDARPFQARVDAARALVKKLKALSAEADRELDRTQALHEQTLISNHELEVVRNASISAASELTRARAALTGAEVEAEYARIHAPFAGVIAARRAESGQAVVNQCQVRPLLILADDRRWLARASLPVGRAADLVPGTEVTVRVGGRDYPGRVGLAASPDPASSENLSLDVLFSADDAGLRAGLPATLILPARAD